MSDSTYEDYMRSVLGYQPMNCQDTYEMNYFDYRPQDMFAFSNYQNDELESCYPDIYKIIYPMVQKACTQNVEPLTREKIDKMTEEIYNALEGNEIIENRTSENKDVKNSNTKSEDRQVVTRRNSTLNDLIRILILREILGRPGFPGRPPMRPRTPMRPGPRPPMRPQPRPYNRQAFGIYEDNYDIYE